MIGGFPHTTQEGERPSLVLERQPPLPKTTPVRLVEHNDDGGQERALVPITPYGEELSYVLSEERLDWSRTPHISLLEGQFNMDLNTLMFIAGQARMLMVPKRALNMPLGPCYNYSGHHLIEDCPHPRKSQQINIATAVPALARYCLYCGVKHLVHDCPLNPEQKTKQP